MLSRRCSEIHTCISANSFIIHEFSAPYPGLNHSSSREVRGQSLYVIPPACSGSTPGVSSLSDVHSIPPQVQGSMRSFINALNFAARTTQKVHKTRQDRDPCEKPAAPGDLNSVRMNPRTVCEGNACQSLQAQQHASPRGSSKTAA